MGKTTNDHSGIVAKRGQEVQNHSGLSSAHAIDQDCIRKLRAWTIDATRLVTYLHNRISCNLVVWKRFTSARGDIGYFHDMSTPGARLRLEKIRKSFERLTDLRTELTSFLRRCEEFTRIVRAAHDQSQSIISANDSTS